MNAPVSEIPTDADIAKAQLAREAELQRLVLRDRMHIWRDAVADCLEQATGYATMAINATSLDDDEVLRHGLVNFLAAARMAQSIYRNDRPKMPWENAAPKDGGAP